MGNLNERFLFVNSINKHCGAYQYGFRLANLVSKTLRNFDYVEVGTYEAFSLAYENQPVVVFNYVAVGRPSGPLAWLSQNHIDNLRNLGVRVGTVRHLSDVKYNFDFVLSQNPKVPNAKGTYPLPRPLPNFAESAVDNGNTYSYKKESGNRPLRVGSFGFASDSKGFPGIIKLVCSQCVEAEINLNITSASYNDEDGKVRKSIVQRCIDVDRPEGVSLNISETFLDDQELLIFLSANDINIFNYEDCDDGGISSVVDFAVASQRPFGVSGSKMFSHVDRTHSIIERRLVDIIDSSTPNSFYITLWSPDALCDALISAINIEMLLTGPRKP